MKTDHSIPFKLFFTLIFGALILVSGISCNTGNDPLMAMLDTQLSNVKIDSLTRTMNFVVSPQRFEKTQFEEKLAASLNRWGEAEEGLLDNSRWQRDAAVDETLKKFSGLQVADDVNGIGFVNTDSYYLQQNYWARKLAERLVAIRELGPFEVIRVESEINTSDVDEDVDPLAVAIAKIQGIDESDAQSLSKALKCFDWVARNIMLLSDNSLVEANGADELKLKDAATNPESGIPGLGYTRFPAQTMLTSRGDYVDRAKVFMTMLNQLEIDSVMLTVKTDDDKRMPWAVGVFVGKDLYLFDTKLGLPIPGKKLGSIATLANLRNDSALLKSLDLSVNESLKESTKYWVDEEKLKSLQALVYCPPESVSYRFWELENKLVGDARMNLTVNPSGIIKKLANLELETGIWDIDFETHQFRRTLRDAIAEASFKNDTAEKIRWYYADEYYINEFVRYRTARSKYFHGLFETIRNDGNLNAIELFYNMIYKDSKIDSLATDQLFQQALSINQGKMASAEFENVIKGVQANMRLVRRDSGYFLSQCHFDNGNFSTSENWLTRLENIEDTQRWQQAINYLKARSLEAQRDYASAIDIYKKQDSEHFHGDMIRVRQLQKLIESVGTLKKEAPKNDEAVLESQDDSSANIDDENAPENPSDEKSDDESKQPELEQEDADKDSNSNDESASKTNDNSNIDDEKEN